MIAGIIVAAAADQLTLARPGVVGNGPASWMILGGVGLFLAGHAAFKAVVWRRASWPRIVAVAVLALLGLAAPHLSALALSACAAAVVVAVAVTDFAWRPAGVPERAATEPVNANEREPYSTSFRIVCSDSSWSRR
jgi:low temperature requirement protein LtrA